jgi:hypothetical protein
MTKGMRGLYGILAVAPAMALFPLAAQAAAPLPVFGGWTVNNGVITEQCPTGFNCEILVGGTDGFAQISVTAVGEPTYIWTIITDPNANTGDPNIYRDESFVRQGADNGILAQQSHQQTDVNGVFVNTSTLQIGWANPTPDEQNPNLVINQGFTGIDDEFISTFDMLIIHDANGEVQDRSMTIDQQVIFAEGTPVDDQQRFLLEQRSGQFTSASSVTFGECQEADCTVAWANGDEVMMRWIGQQINLEGQGVSLFGFQGVTNLTTPDEATTFSLDSTGINDGANGATPPFVWDQTFGATPPSLQQ